MFATWSSSSLIARDTAENDRTFCLMAAAIDRRPLNRKAMVVYMASLVDDSIEANDALWSAVLLRYRMKVIVD